MTSIIKKANSRCIATIFAASLSKTSIFIIIIIINLITIIQSSSSSEKAWPGMIDSPNRPLTFRPSQRRQAGTLVRHSNNNKRRTFPRRPRQPTNGSEGPGPERSSVIGRQASLGNREELRQEEAGGDAGV